MSKKTKAARNEVRQRAARNRMRLHTFIALLIPVMDAWDIGMKGGGKIGDIRFKPLDVPREEARFLKMELPKVAKARDAVVRELGIASFDVGKNFYATADGKLQVISEAVVEALPAEASHTDSLRALTYIVYAALWDLVALTDDSRPSVQKLVSAVGRIANYILPASSSLVLPMNAAYYATRNMMQENPEWYEVDWSNAPQEVWIEAHAEAGA